MSSAFLYVIRFAARFNFIRLSSNTFYAEFINRLYHIAGYMPTDLYNLNSAYGTEEELKHCVEEMHTQDLLVC